MGTQSPSPKRGPSSLPIFGPVLLWPNGCMHQNTTWYGARPRPRRLCVRWGPSLPPQKGGGAPPQFSAHIYCRQTARCIKMPLRMDVGLSPGDFVLDGDPVPLPKKGRSPQFSAVYCGQTAAWIKMPLGTEVYVGLRDIVFDGDPAPLPSRGTAPNFRPLFPVAKRQDGLICHLVWM